MIVPEGITEILEKKSFTHSVEVFPPRNGRPPETILNKLEALSELPIDFVSVTKGAMGSMRGGTVPIGYMISERYDMNALVHFRCRDMIRREVENLLVDHMYFGTKNILAVLGDPLPNEPETYPDPQTHNRYACELVRQISNMNHGKYLPLANDHEQYRKGMKTDFCIGVACYPEAEDMENELYVMGEKTRAGADFGITQMIFNVEAYTDYLDGLRANGINIPIISGIRPVSSLKHVKAAETIFSAKVPLSLKDALEGRTADQIREMCIDFSIGLIDELKEAGSPGVHMFILNDVEMASDILGRL